MMIKQADISEKPVILRVATATGRIVLKKSTLDRMVKGKIAKGDAVAVAKVMGVLATKQTPNLLALCHQLKLEQTTIDIEIRKEDVEVTATVMAHEKTGVEMEALTAVSVALLNIWDVVKAYEKDSNGGYPTAVIEGIRVLKKFKGPAER